METKKQGGKRRGAGRKPILDKKKQISLYVETGKVVKFGNEEKMKERLYKFIDGYDENSEIEFVAPTMTAYNGKKTERVTHDEPGQWEVPKSPITGLAPKISFFSEFMNELNSATTVGQVESIMKRAKGEVFTPRDKMALENRAKEVSKDMYTD